MLQNSPKCTQVNMNKKEETKRTEEHASLKSRKGRRDESRKEEQTAMQSQMPCDNATEGLTDTALQRHNKTQILDEARPEDVEQKQNPAKQSQMPCDNNTEDLTDTALQKQDETQNLGEPRPEVVEQKQKDADNKKKRQIGQSEEEGAEEETDAASSHPTREEDNEIKKKKNDLSNTEISYDMNKTSGVNCAAPNEGKSRKDEEAQEATSNNEDSARSSITPENTKKSEEQKNAKVDGAAINVGAKSKYFCEQPLDEGKKTKEQKLKGIYPQRHYGLYNQGNTCYLNSVLQVLFMTTEIHDRLDWKFETDQELRKLFEHLKTKISGTENITKILGIENVFMQRDAPECLEMILLKISPAASELFQGKLAHATKCSQGHSINEEINPFWSLPLSLKDTYDTTYSVESSFESFFQKKSFSGDNKVYCNECNNKKDATSECEMVKSPQILTLLLKRFDFDLYTMSYVKSHRCVEVPSELKTKNEKYKLYGMVDHHGDLYGGHYTATVLSNEDKAWYKCNDCHVNKVQEQLFEETGTFKSRTVYLLMYKADNLPRADRKISKIESTLRQALPYCLLLLCAVVCRYCFGNKNLSVALTNLGRRIGHCVYGLYRSLACLSDAQ